MKKKMNVTRYSFQLFQSHQNQLFTSKDTTNHILWQQKVINKRIKENTATKIALKHWFFFTFSEVSSSINMETLPPPTISIRETKEKEKQKTGNLKF